MRFLRATYFFLLIARISFNHLIKEMTVVLTKCYRWTGRKLVNGQEAADDRLRFINYLVLLYWFGCYLLNVDAFLSVSSLKITIFIKNQSSKLLFFMFCKSRVLRWMLVYIFLVRSSIWVSRSGLWIIALDGIPRVISGKSCWQHVKIIKNNSYSISGRTPARL